jgi:hypothetical protein
VIGSGEIRPIVLPRGDSLFLAEERSCRTASIVRSLLSRTNPDSGTTIVGLRAAAAAMREKRQSAETARRTVCEELESHTTAGHGCHPPMVDGVHRASNSRQIDAEQSSQPAVGTRRDAVEVPE